MTRPTMSPILRRGAGNMVRWGVQMVGILINAVVFAMSLMGLTFLIAITASRHVGLEGVLVALGNLVLLVLSVLNLAVMLRPYRDALDANPARERGKPSLRWLLAGANTLLAVGVGSVVLAAARAPADHLGAVILVGCPLTCAAAHTWPPSYLQPHECQGCEYDLTQVLGDVCPECGRTRES